MNNEELLRHITNELGNGQDVEFEHNINNIPFKIKLLANDMESRINIPSILLVPLSKNANNQIVLEANNLESYNLQDILKQGMQTGIHLVGLTKEAPTPIVIPLIPSYKDGPYFQQLSKECFDSSCDNENYRIDEQIVRIIQKCRQIFNEETVIKVNDKIFLNGYSSSGVFAQRFALLHPEIVETACIGGASGSIPLPIANLSYPIGISDYEQLTGKKFDFQSYQHINFRYYVGELEIQNKSETRFDEDGNKAPMHDMSYFDKSVPKEVGQKQRILLGQDMFTRANNTVEALKSMGINIEHKVILGRSHSNISGIGVNELGDEFVSRAYRESIRKREIDDIHIR